MAFLRIETIDARVAGSGDALTRLRCDDIQALIIENVLSASECQRLVADLEAEAQDFPQTSFPGPFRSSFRGANLNLATPDLVDYFAATPRFDAALSAWMRPVGGFEARILDMLSAHDGGLPYRAPPPLDRERRYIATTLRAHREGGYIPAHFDNEQMQRPTFRFLAPLIEGDLFSFVLTLGRGLEGGVLEVFDATADRFGAAFVNRDTPGRRPDLASLDSVVFDVAEGSIVLLRSGRHLHRVRPVVGARTRWTMCSFMAAAKDAAAVLCWG